MKLPIAAASDVIDATSRWHYYKVIKLSTLLVGVADWPHYQQVYLQCLVLGFLWHQVIRFVYAGGNFLSLDSLM